MKTQRLISLDVFRGLTVAFMILVNNPGSWGHIYAPLRHAEWHGWTPTDLVFPFFLFAVGVAISLSFAKCREVGMPTQALVRKIAVRSIVIFGLGLILNAFPYQDLTNVRIWGVLQRIAVSYLVAGLTVALVARTAGRVVVLIGLLLAYEFLMRWPLVSEWGNGSFAIADNFARWVDLQWPGPSRLTFEGFLPFEPEGLVPSLSAAVVCLFGFFAGEGLRKTEALENRLVKLVALGAALAVLGLLLSSIEPINKKLWTSSYTFLMSGLAALVLAGCAWLMDARGWVKGFKPFVAFGSNALLAFVGTGFAARVIVLVKWPDSSLSVKSMIYHNGLVPRFGELNGSLVFALGTVLIWWFLLWLLHKRQIFIKI
ncbi:MAG: putative acyltransferase [Candidatus Krumholzibacteriia bacterium]|jgi:predicted acyltransferase